MTKSDIEAPTNLLYVLVAHGTIILAEHGEPEFAPAALTVLSELPPNSSIPPTSPAHDVTRGILDLPASTTFPYHWPRYRERRHGTRTADGWKQYLFHYVSDNGLTFLVMADKFVGEQIPFAFLAALQQLFSTSTDAFSLSRSNTDELSAQVGALTLEYNTNPPQEALAQTQIGQSSDGVTVYHYQQWNKDGKIPELAGETSA